MSKLSAGLVMYRIRKGQLQVLLVHPGGPFWTKKDSGAWFVPKGEINRDEDQLSAAKREFEEETGLKPDGIFVPLGSVKQKSGKTITAWAFKGNCDPALIKSNTFTMEWPPKSGKQQQFPEIDRANFFTFEQAKGKIYPAELELLVRLKQLCNKRQSQKAFTVGAR
jgi:predicted NUDIX family NTP pyrophosphohydrolase